MDQNKFNLTRNGITKLPPGFRFQPTDEELVFEYLKRKILSWQLPASIIPEINLYNYDPWGLPGESEKEKYFFSSKEAKYRNGNRINRCTPSGYWKSTGLDRQIGSPNKVNQVVGMKKTLVFYTRAGNGRPDHSCSKTDWIMHEYRIVNFNSTSQNFCNPEAEKWILCRIFLKNNRENVGTIKETKFFDFLNQRDYELSVCSSSSSTMTDEVTSTGEDDDEHVSRNFFST